MSKIVMASLITKPIKATQIFDTIRLATKGAFYKMFHVFFFVHSISSLTTEYLKILFTFLFYIKT